MPLPRGEPTQTSFHKPETEGAEMSYSRPQSACATLAPHGKLGETRQVPSCCQPSSGSGLEEGREGAAF